ncbi:chaperone binding / ATPase activator [Rhynchospora pubera]|uniref:Chaperone binding / ATPase activator n=1 Tax=Rhynchospora pubera TaxID=906938 RepID=A0AAV8HDY4_9POAL|nr:chaperone binding / ATPase activator [Rhynchospora pubera]
MAVKWLLSAEEAGPTSDWCRGGFWKHRETFKGVGVRQENKRKERGAFPNSGFPSLSPLTPPLDLIWSVPILSLITALSLAFLFKSRSNRRAPKRIEMEEMATAAAAPATEAEETKKASYRYWVREAKEDAAPPPVPRKLSPDDIPKLQSNSSSLGSVWNQAGTWEEKNLNSWASNRLKELLGSLGALEFSSGNASIDGVSKCSGDAFLVTVRNKKKVNYTYELSLKFKGEWKIKDENKAVKGHLDIPEFSFGEVDDLEIDVRFSDDKSLETADKTRISKDLRSFLSPIREKLNAFEEELKDR